MIITSNQSDFLSDHYEYLLQLGNTSSLPFPYGLPGWKALNDMNTLCTKLLKLNRWEPVSVRKRTDSMSLWYRTLMRIQACDDPEENLSTLVRTIPVIYELMEKEDVMSR